MSEVRFALRENVKDFAGASTHVRDGQVYNVGEALEEGGGVIVTDDPVTISALEGLDVLKKVGASKVDEAKTGFADKVDGENVTPPEPPKTPNLAGSGGKE
jgi:hypothetical protein